MEKLEKGKSKILKSTFLGRSTLRSVSHLTINRLVTSKNSPIHESKVLLKDQRVYTL